MSADAVTLQILYLVADLQERVARLETLDSPYDKYDIGDGYNDTINASTTLKLLRFQTPRAFLIDDVKIKSDGGSDDVTLTIAIDGATIISAVGSGATWTVTATFPISVAANATYTSQVTTVTQITGFGYGLKGHLA